MSNIENVMCRGAYTDKPLAEPVSITVHSKFSGVKVACPYLLTVGSEFNCGAPHHNDDVVKDGIRLLEKCYHKYPR